MVGRMRRVLARRGPWPLRYGSARARAPGRRRGALRPPAATARPRRTFLRTAEVVRKKGIGIGVSTRAEQYTLRRRDGGTARGGRGKTIDEFKRGVTSLEGGAVYRRLRRLLQARDRRLRARQADRPGPRPPDRRADLRRHGRAPSSSWVEGAMSEADRKQKKIAPPDPRAWNEQMYKVRLLHQLDRQHRLSATSATCSPTRRSGSTRSTARAPSPSTRTCAAEKELGPRLPVRCSRP